jgi:hypothetical protein
MKTRGMRRIAGAKVLGSILLLTLAGVPVLAAEDPGAPPPGAVGYDVERGIWLYDTDGDTFPDLTEELGGTDPRDPASNPLALLEAAGRSSGGSGESKVGFTRRNCRAGFMMVPGAPHLCINQWVQNATNYTQAAANCRAQQARVCTYEDFGYLFIATPYDATFNTAGRWLGDFTQDNWVNCGNFSITFDNDPDIWDFEGTCSKWDRRDYWCCHDRDPQHALP